MFGFAGGYHRIALLAALVIGALLAWAVPAYAGIGVVPSKVELQGDAGDSIPFSISVTNGSDTPVTTEIFAWDFARDETGMPTRIGPDDVETFRGCSPWLVAPLPRPVTIQPQDTTTFDFEVAVPDSTSDGTRYCYITFNSTPILPDQEVPESGYTVQAPVTYSISAMLLVSVGIPDMSAPILRRDIAIEDMSARTLSMDGSVPLNLRILNDGNVHANLAEGSRIQIWKGDTLADEIMFQEYTLLPENSLAIPAVWRPDASFGRFTARFVGDVGSADPIVAEETFWVLDWQLLVAIAIGLVVLVVVGRLFFRRFKIQLAPRTEPE